jgi:hypothetical protein
VLPSAISNVLPLGSVTLAIRCSNIAPWYRFSEYTEPAAHVKYRPNSWWAWENIPAARSR